MSCDLNGTCCTCQQRFDIKELFVPQKQRVSGILLEKTGNRDFFLCTGNLALVTYCRACFVENFGNAATMYFLESTAGNLLQFQKRSVSENSTAPHFTQVEEFSKASRNVKGFLPHPLYVAQHFDLQPGEQITQKHMDELLATHFYCMNFYGSSFPYYEAVFRYQDYNRMHTDSEGEFDAPYCNVESHADNSYKAPVETAETTDTVQWHYPPFDHIKRAVRKELEADKANGTNVVTVEYLQEQEIASPDKWFMDQMYGAHRVLTKQQVLHAIEMYKSEDDNTERPSSNSTRPRNRYQPQA